MESAVFVVGVDVDDRARLGETTIPKPLAARLVRLETTSQKTNPRNFMV